MDDTGTDDTEVVPPGNAVRTEPDPPEDTVRTELDPPRDRMGWTTSVSSALERIKPARFLRETLLCEDSMLLARIVDCVP